MYMDRHLTFILAVASYGCFLRLQMLGGLADLGFSADVFRLCIVGESLFHCADIKQALTVELLKSCVNRAHIALWELFPCHS